MEKKLYKSNDNKLVDGVCGGSGFLAYIIAAIIIPRRPEYPQS